MERLKARPTLYRGIQMRSRNEAGFAQWLDRHFWNWEYEPDCFADPTGQYLPDFRVLFNERPGSGIYVEVKPTRATAWAARDAMLPIRSTYRNAALVVVAPNSNSNHYVCHGTLVPGSDVWQRTNGYWPDLPSEISSACQCGREWIDPEYGRCEACWRFCCMDCGGSLPGLEEASLSASLFAVRRDECDRCGDSTGGGYCARCLSLNWQSEQYGNTVTGDVRTDLALHLTPDPGPGPDLCAACWAKRGVA